MRFRFILKNTLTYGVSVVAGKLASVLLTPVYTRYLTPADYGVIELLDLTTFVVSILVGYYLADAFLYNYSNASDEKRDRVLSTAFYGSMGIGLAVALAALATGAQLSRLIFGTERYAFYFHLVFANFVLLFPGEIACAHIRFQNRSTLLMKVQLVRLGLGAALNVGFLVVWHLGIASLLYGSLVATAFVAISGGFLSLARVRAAFDGRIFAQLLRYAFPLGLSGIAMLSVNYGDRYFLRRSTSLAGIGIYSLSYKIGMLVSYVQWIFSMFWSAQMFTLMRTPEGRRTYSRVTTYLTVAVLYVGLMLCVLVHPILRVLATPQFAGAAVYVPAIVLTYVIKSLGEHFRCMIFVEKRPDLEVRITAVGAAVCMAAYALWIPRYTFFGAIAATALAFVVMASYGFRQAQRLSRSTFEWRRMGLAWASAALTYAAHLWLDPRTLAAQVLWGAGATVLYGGLLWAFGFFSGEERDAIAASLRRLRAGGTSAAAS